MTTLSIGDKVNVNIVKNGYWVDSVRGKIVSETAKFWIVDGGGHHFYDDAKGDFVTRRFSKTGGAVSKRS